jgi:hypothetical protein
VLTLFLGVSIMKMNKSRIPIKDSYELEDNSIGFLECSASRRHRSEGAVTRAGTDAFRQND